jgi:hypothetical protein
MLSRYPNSVYTNLIFNTTVAGALYTTPNVSRRPLAIQITNQLATTAHWVGITANSTAPVSGTTPLVMSFWNPGTAGFQAVIDKDTIENLIVYGFTIVRSSTPTVYTQLGATLTQPCLITVLTTF